MRIHERVPQHPDDFLTRLNIERGANMKKEILLSVLALVAVFGMVTMASANSTTWTYLTVAADAGMGPGGDLLMGTGDDVADANNADGAYTVAGITWDPADEACGPPSVGYMTGTEVRFMGCPPGGYETTYLNVESTETMEGTGTITMELKPGGTNGGTGCGLGIYSGTSEMQMIMLGGAPMPQDPTTTHGQVFDADTAVSGDYVCGGGIITFTQAYLEALRTKLPAAATYFIAGCADVEFGPGGIQCLNNAVSETTSIMWTDGTINCTEDCGGGGGSCSGGPLP